MIQFAYNYKKEKIYIDDTVNEEYFCPICKEKLIARKGDVNIHHFSHMKKSKCIMNNGNYMSEWHIKWQNKFSKDKREIIFEKDDEIRIADVFLKEKNIVIEFQHSPISVNEFNNRNKFYNSLGNKVIWVIDLLEQNDEEQIINEGKNYYKWLHPKKFLTYYDKKTNVEIYFNISLNAAENKRIINIENKIKEKFELGTQEEPWYYRHKKDKFLLVELDEIFRFDRTYFYTKNEFCSVEEFIEYISNK